MCIYSTRTYTFLYIHYITHNIIQLLFIMNDDCVIRSSYMISVAEVVVHKSFAIRMWCSECEQFLKHSLYISRVNLY